MFNKKYKKEISMLELLVDELDKENLELKNRLNAIDKRTFEIVGKLEKENKQLKKKLANNYKGSK
ncbi:MAG: hypothetical protein R3Y05_01460 [bacterium]